MTSNVHMCKVSVIGVLVGILLGGAAVSRAQQPPPPRPPTPPAASEEEELAKKLSNPVSDLVSVPFQFNWQQNVGPSEATRFILNVQPVMPFSLNKDWNLIARVIVPFVSQPTLVDGGEASLRRQRHSPAIQTGRTSTRCSWNRSSLTRRHGP